MSTNFDPEEWISQAEAARLRGVSRQAISKLVQADRITAMSVGGHVLVRRSDVMTYVPKKAGRPKAT